MDHLPADIPLDFSNKQLKALILKAEQVLKTKRHKISRDHAHISKYVDVREKFVGETLSAKIEAELESLDLKNRRGKGNSTVWLTSDNTDGTSNVAHDIKNYPGISQLMKRINDSEFVDNNRQLNSCLVTCFSTAKRTISLRSDNKKGHFCLNRPICVVSFGAERNIEIADLKSSLLKSFTPINGGLYIMKEGSQSFLKHIFTADKHIVSGNNVRYSMSFRRLLGNKAFLDGHAMLL